MKVEADRPVMAESDTVHTPVSPAPAPHAPQATGLTERVQTLDACLANMVNSDAYFTLRRSVLGLAACHANQPLALTLQPPHRLAAYVERLDACAATAQKWVQPDAPDPQIIADIAILVAASGAAKPFAKAAPERPLGLQLITPPRPTPTAPDAPATPTDTRSRKGNGSAASLQVVLMDPILHDVLRLWSAPPPQAEKVQCLVAAVARAMQQSVGPADPLAVAHAMALRDSTHAALLRPICILRTAQAWGALIEQAGMGAKVPMHMSFAVGMVAAAALVRSVEQADSGVLNQSWASYCAAARQQIAAQPDRFVRFASPSLLASHCVLPFVQAQRPELYHPGFEGVCRGLVDSWLLDPTVLTGPPTALARRAHMRQARYRLINRLPTLHALQIEPEDVPEFSRATQEAQSHIMMHALTARRVQEIHLSRTRLYMGTAAYAHAVRNAPTERTAQGGTLETFHEQAMPLWLVDRPLPLLELLKINRAGGALATLFTNNWGFGLGVRGPSAAHALGLRFFAKTGEPPEIQFFDPDHGVYSFVGKSAADYQGAAAAFEAWWPKWLNFNPVYRDLEISSKAVLPARQANASST